MAFARREHSLQTVTATQAQGDDIRDDLFSCWAPLLICFLAHKVPSPGQLFARLSLELNKVKGSFNVFLDDTLNLSCVVMVVDDYIWLQISALNKCSNQSSLVKSSATPDSYNVCLFVFLINCSSKQITPSAENEWIIAQTWMCYKNSTAISALLSIPLLNIINPEA